MNRALLAAYARAAWRSRWRRLTQIIVTIALVAWLVSKIDHRTWASLASIPASTLLLALVTFASAQAISATRLWLLTPGVSLDTALDATWSGYFWGNFLPTSVGGDAVRLMRLHRDGVPLDTAAGALVIDRLSNLLVTVSIALSLMAVPFAQKSVWLLGVLAVAAAVGVLGSGLMRWRVVDRLRAALMPALQLVRQPMRGFAIAALSVVNISLSVLAQWWLARAVHIQIDPLSMAQISATLTIVVMLPISLNGLGLQEAGYVAALVRAGAAMEDAIAFSLLVRLLMLATSLIAGGFVMVDSWRSKHIEQSS